MLLRRPPSWPAWPYSQVWRPTSIGKALPTSSSDIASARRISCVVKLLAICELSSAATTSTGRSRCGSAYDSAHPPLASVSGAYNAVFVESQSAGRLMFYGPGAGGSPTASAVLGDLVTVARNRVQARWAQVRVKLRSRPVVSIGRVMTRYISLRVADVTQECWRRSPSASRPT